MLCFIERSLQNAQSVASSIPSIGNDKRAELFVPAGFIAGRMPTAAILISLATWLPHRQHQIPDYVYNEKKLINKNTFQNNAFYWGIWATAVFHFNVGSGQKKVQPSQLDH